MENTRSSVRGPVLDGAGRGTPTLGAIKLFKRGYGRYKPQILILAVLGLFSGLLEGVGITAIVPVFAKLTGAGGADDAISTALVYVFDRFDLGLGLKVMLVFIVFAFIMKAVVLIIAQYIAAKIETNYAKETREALLGGVMEASWPFLVSQKGGHLETALLVDVERSRILLKRLTMGIVSSATILVYVLVAFNISPIITLLSIFSGAVLFLLIKPMFYRLRQISKRVSDTNKEMTHFVSENVSGIKIVKAFSAEGPLTRRARWYFDTLRQSYFKMLIFSGISNISIEPLSVIFIVGVFSFLYLSGDFQFAAFAAIMYLIHRIFTRIQALQGTAHNINQLIPYLEHTVSAVDLSVKNKEKYSGSEPFYFQDTLEFKEVRFAYDKKPGVLRNITFQAPRGSMIGIVGKSGSGKTTLADLLLRLIEPRSGDITIDTIPIKNISIEEWRGNIGYVPQDAFAINDTFENNIRFYGENITKEDVERAAKTAYIYKFIMSQPNGFATEVGERGVMISGGEKQRLMLARALARKPQVLILDEATSALDNESELMIQKAIEQMRGKTTIFVIAHRLSTLLNCDKIFVLEGGMIKESGSPKELLEDKTSRFYETYNIRGNTQRA